MKYSDIHTPHLIKEARYYLRKAVHEQSVCELFIGKLNFHSLTWRKARVRKMVSSPHYSYYSLFLFLITVLRSRSSKGFSHSFVFAIRLIVITSLSTFSSPPSLFISLTTISTSPRDWWRRRTLSFTSRLKCLSLTHYRQVSQRNSTVNHCSSPRNPIWRKRARVIERHKRVKDKNRQE